MTLSAEGRQLLLDFEVGGGEPYYRKFLRFPTWPGESSGVTIGVGFDLGYHTQAQFSEAWGALLADDNSAILARALGIKRQPARELLAADDEMRDVEIPWDKALDVFERITVPRWYLATLRIYPQILNLPDAARDALVSLVFNRGSDLIGPRRVEMADIQKSLKQNNFQAIPALIRSMKRLWPNPSSDKPSGLQRRREAEAALFEKAIA